MVQAGGVREGGVEGAIEDVEAEGGVQTISSGGDGDYSALAGKALDEAVLFHPCDSEVVFP